MNNQFIAKELLSVAGILLAVEVPDWVDSDFVVSLKAPVGTQKFRASIHGVSTWVIQTKGKGRVYKDQFGAVSSHWQLSPVLVGRDWAISSTLSFAPATSGSFAMKKFEEFKDSVRLSGSDNGGMFGAYKRTITEIPSERHPEKSIEDVIRAHEKNIKDAKRFWKIAQAEAKYIGLGK